MFLDLCVIGNIGSGKSYLLEQTSNILEEMGYKIVFEPVKLWKNFNNTNIIKEMYNSRELTSLGQIFIHMTLLDEYTKINKKRFMERSIFDSQNIFTLNLYNQNFIT